MSNSLKKGIAMIAVAAVCAGSVSASAAEWRLSGYETSNAGLGSFYQETPLIYQEFDDNGFTTGRTVSGVEAQEAGLRGFGKVEFKEPWVDRAYPNNEYAKMFVDGKYSGRVFATGRYGSDVVEYRNCDFMWEAAAPYRVYNRTQAYLVDGWYTDTNYPMAYSGHNASVVTERTYYGFGDYNVIADNTVTMIPDALKAYRDARYTNVLSSIGLTIADLNPSEIPAAPIQMSNSDLKVPRTFDLTLTGPTFNYDGSIANAQGSKLVASKTAPEALGNYGIASLITTLNDTYGNVNYCDITWTTGGFEVAPPHKVYRFLTVDGVVMDGSLIPGTKLYKPYIYQYFGNANPKITWTPEFVDPNGEVVLRRYVDGNIDNNQYSGLKYSGIYTNPEYMEVIDSATATKSLQAVYRFMYNGKEYVKDTDGNTLIVDWSQNVATKVFTDSTILSPYIAE